MYTKRVVSNRPVNVFSHINESWCTYRCVTCMIESCHTIQMSHVTHTYESCHTYQRVMAHISTRPMYDWVMSHNTNESRDTCIGVMSRVSTSHVTHIYELWHTYRCFPCMIESCRTIQMSHVMSHVHRSHVTRINESCHTYQRVMSHDPRRMLKKTRAHYKGEK